MKTKAFMLTFNSKTFGEVTSDKLFEEFCAWVIDQAEKHGATSWSATAEMASSTHLHAYFSWQGPGQKGIDHSTTTPWRFREIKHRVDVNSETRGLWHWLRLYSMAISTYRS